MRELQKRPGCDYESVLRQKAGEPDLEKVQMAVFEQAKLVKKDKRMLCLELLLICLPVLPNLLTTRLSY